MAPRLSLLIGLLSWLQTSESVLLEFENGTRSDFDFLSGLREALATEQVQIPVKTNGDQLVVGEKDVERIEGILKSLNDPSGYLGQACSFRDWSEFIKPTIQYTIEGRRAQAAEAYKHFARAAISNQELVTKVCLSKLMALQCDGLREKCECLYLEPLNVRDPECSAGNGLGVHSTSIGLISILAIVSPIVVTI